ncbi:MAG: zinc ribbon domain-containing protein, partial [Chloroflexi bacterium]|nr:zinc ribbon domain-containing protein [Chloroflexota bacterium]
MTCPQCHHENRPGGKFCSRCRARLPLACPECGGPVEPDDLFCGECAADLSGVAAASPSSASPRPSAILSSTAAPPNLEAQFQNLHEALPRSLREQLLTGAEEGENRVATVLFADMSSSVSATRHLHP